MNAKKLRSIIYTISISLVLFSILSIILCINNGNSKTSEIEFEPECGEFYEFEYAQSESKQILFSGDLEHYIDAYEKNDTNEMNKTFDSLKSAQIEDTDISEIVPRSSFITLVWK